MYTCIRPFLAFTVGHNYTMTERGLIDDDGDERSQIKEGCLILSKYFVKVEEKVSLENK